MVNLGPGGKDRVQRTPACLSVVIPSFNADRWIGGQLEALCLQETNAEWEVILADNGSTDETVGVFNRFVDRFPAARVLNASAVRGQSYARNLGVAAAKGEALVFLDADDVVAPGYLEAVREGLANCDIGVATLDSWTLNGGRPPVVEKPAGEALAPYLGYLPAGPGAALTVWKHVFEQLGGFDLGMPPAEDIDFCWRAQLAGFQVGLIPQAILRYRHRSSPKELFRQALHYGASRPALYKRYGCRGMPRRRGAEAIRFYLGVIPLALGVRTRSDLGSVAGLLGIRLGHLTGSLKHRTWYP